MNNKKQAASQDIFGRDLSYLLACHPRLKRLGDIDLYSHEAESGYTPLHVCLRNGYLQKAFKLYERWKRQRVADYSANQKSVWDLKDREGLTPIELYQFDNDIWNYQKVPETLFPELNDVEDTDPLGGEMRWEKRHQGSQSTRRERHSIRDMRYACQQLRGGRELFTTGSNVNLQLGTGDSEDRQELFKFNEYTLSAFDPRYRARFKIVMMRRYHSLILTADGDVLTAGNGSRGRLGNGSTQLSNLCHTKVELDFHRVHQLDSSDHHSIVLTTGGEVLTWGWNRFSQLGYSTTSVNCKKTDFSALDNTCSTKPKKVGSSPWKKTFSSSAKFVSCSKVHSCLLDDQNNLYCWGLNVGQMGTSKSCNDDCNSEFMGHKGKVVASPMMTKLPPFVQDVKQLSCTEFVTFILYGDNQLCVLNNFKILKFNIPKIVSKQAFSNQFDVFTPNSLSKKNRVVKIKSTHSHGNNLCVLYESGSIGILQSSYLHSSAHGWSKLPNSLPITQNWVPHYGWNKCLDFDVSTDGQVILCTVGGCIYKATTGSSFSFKQFKNNKLISGKVTMVSCDSRFSSFAVIKDEIDMIPTAFPKQNLYNDISSFSPLTMASAPSKKLNSEPLSYRTQKREASSYILENFVKGRVHESKDSPSSPHYEAEYTGAEPTTGDQLWKLFQNRWARADQPTHREYLAKGLSREWEPTLTGSVDFSQFDVIFVDRATYRYIGACHRILLEARVPLLVASLAEFGMFSPKNDSGISFQLKGELYPTNGKTVVEVSSGRLIPESLCYALHYLYTDSVPTVSNLPGTTKKKDLETSIKIFVKALDLHLSTFRGDQLSFALSKILDHSLGSGNSLLRTCPDVKVRLSGENVVEVHSFMLQSRSAYFATLFSENWAKRVRHTAEINMPHVSHNEMTCILKYIHGISFQDLFTHCHFTDYKSFVNFVLGVIQVSDEWMMADLKYYLETTLIDYIDASTVMVILVNAHRLLSKTLLIECCWFIHHNIGLLFSEENSKIIEEFFDSHLWAYLEGFISRAKVINGKAISNTSYEDENQMDHLISLFQESRPKFNDIFMNPSDRFEPSFDLGLPLKRPTGAKLSTDRRRSSSNRKASLSQEDLINVRRPSSNSAEARGLEIAGLDFSLLTKYNEEAIGHDFSDLDDQGFVTVGKSRRRASKNRNDEASIADEWGPSVSGKENPRDSLNMAKFEGPTSSIIKEYPLDTESRVKASTTKLTRQTMFPSLSNTSQGPPAAPSPRPSSADGSKSNSATFSGVKKLSQKERIKLAAETNTDPPIEKKAVWGGNSSRKSFAATQTLNAASSAKFPSLSKSLKEQNIKKKPSSVGLTSMGESSAIPLYLANAKTSPPKPARSLKDAIEEERFAKWWAEESEKVQQQLKNQETEVPQNGQGTSNADRSFGTGGSKERYKAGRSRKPLKKERPGAKAAI
ncbi:LADA_0F01442g1_1 [Lachancea dasiensis]|uniref:LADA_0F01442g1_1 n=1 Tax=Lachancea dasiensis TaxID=1072105 RepID=A0A1G4JI21_9SACH|nr:LADA_0F01442g1_1 [Lachancea dasiensis]